MINYFDKRRVVWLKNNLFFTMLIIVLTLFLGNLCLIFLPYSKEARGTFGDQFGAVNALFSGLAFAGLIYTIILQRHDLKLQRRDLHYQRRDLELNRKELALNRKELELTRMELELTRQEMEEQTAEFEKQNETLKIQRFENTFFNMLSQFQEVVNNLKVSKEFYGGEGRDCFEKTYAKNEQIEQSFNDFDHLSLSSIILRDGINGYKRSETPKYFDHYFRLLYRILKFVNDSKVITGFDEKYEYTAMLRAMLSRYELVWLYYNGLSYGAQKLKPLIERYAMLNNLRPELLVKGKPRGFGEYKDSAFKKTYPDEIIDKNVPLLGVD